jgi:hypothetical protein
LPENEWIAAKFMYHLLSEEWKYQDLEGKFQEELQFISGVIGGVKRVFVGATKKHCDQLCQWMNPS